MLANLKRVYVNMQSFPQARDVIDMLIAVDPSAINELRDRGLLAYHLKDFSGALRDLQAYLKLIPSGRGRRRGAAGSRADLGARQDAPQAGRFAELRRRGSGLRISDRVLTSDPPLAAKSAHSSRSAFAAVLFCPSGQSFSSGQIVQCGSLSVHVAAPWCDR